jgi:uncharacterized protein (TIGR02217 family)
MSHRRAYIRACETFGWVGGPNFSTRIVAMANGRERRNADWEQPQHQFILPYGNIDETAYKAMLQMFLNVRGRNEGFLYRNRLNHTAQDELLAVAEPGQTEFQLATTNIVDGIPYQMQVFALYVPNEDDGAIAVPATPVVKVNGTPASISVDHDRGGITTTPMTGGEVLTWSGQFSHWVRFGSDRFAMSIENKGPRTFFISGDVELVEIAPPQEIVS